MLQQRRADGDICVLPRRKSQDALQQRRQHPEEETCGDDTTYPRTQTQLSPALPLNVESQRMTERKPYEAQYGHLGGLGEPREMHDKRAGHRVYGTVQPPPRALTQPIGALRLTLPLKKIVHGESLSAQAAAPPICGERS